MDRLIAGGAAGLMEVTVAGREAATHTGHLALFGQDDTRSDYARGPMEACGVGFDLRPGDVALRFNFATVDDEDRIIDRRAGRIREEAEPLVRDLNRIQIGAPVQLYFLSATEHRGVLVLRGQDLSPAVTDSDPGTLNSHREVLKVRPTIGGRAALQTADYLNRIIRASHEVLDGHPVNRRRRAGNLAPANIILTRGAGSSRRYVHLPERLAIGIACVSGEATVLGLARLCGIDACKTSAMTANLDTDLGAKAALTAERLKDCNLVYLHLKGCDIAGHDRSPENKLRFIERTDAMLGDLLERLDVSSDLCIVALGDHCTLSETGDHCDDPVPVFIHGPGIPADSVSSYGERSCSQGRLGRHSPRQLMEMLFEKLIRVPELRGGPRRRERARSD